jgi:deazaflavin-dependent oxidoreductase (nitroreductase family)
MSTTVTRPPETTQPTSKNSLANHLVTSLLRNPVLSPLLSGHTLLVSVRGRKTGAIYTTPVNYVREGNTLLVLSRTDRTWWKNLRGGAPITVLLKGKEIQGTAEVIERNPDAVAWVYGEWHPHPRNAVRAMEKARRRTEGKVLIRITLPP